MWVIQTRITYNETRVCNSDISPDEVTMFIVSSTSKHVLGTLAQLRKELIISKHVKVFYHISAGRTFINCSLFTVWNNGTRSKKGFKQPVLYVWRYKGRTERSKHFAVRKLACVWPWMTKTVRNSGFKKLFQKAQQEENTFTVNLYLLELVL